LNRFIIMTVSRALLVAASYALAALCLAACATAPRSPAVAARSPDALYPLKAETASDQVALAIHAEGLSPAQTQALRALAARRGDRMGGPVRLNAPRGAGDAARAAAALAGARAVLAAAGVPASEILVGGYDATDAQAPLLASYAYDRAEIPKCGRQAEFTRTAANEVDANFGCSVTANMAAQIANPSDILRPRGEDAPDADRRLTVLGKYREGKVTNSDDAEGKSGVISSVAR
jgi:pilus assembly protein CpaD